MSNQEQHNINQPIFGSTRDTASFPAGSAVSGQQEPVGPSTYHSTQQGSSLGAKLDSAVNQAGQKFGLGSEHGTSTQHGTENLSQRHPIWSDASKAGSDVREGFGSQSTQPSSQESYLGSDQRIGESKWTDTSSNLGQADIGAHSTTSTYPTTTTGTSLSSNFDSYSTSASYPSYSTTTYPASTSSYTESTTQKYTDQSGMPSHETKTEESHEHKSSEHKSTTEKIKEKAHHAAEVGS